MKIDGFMVAMLGAILLAFIAPELGASEGPLRLGELTHYGIGLIFFLHGAGMSRQSLKAGLRNWRLHALIQSSTFLLFPLIGFLFYFTTAPGVFVVEPLLPAELRLGFFFLCALPSTISSSVALTAVARGNVPAAIFNATFSGLLGMVLTPLLVGIVVATSGAELDIIGAVLDIAVTLLVPFAFGQLLRPLVIEPMIRHKSFVTRADRAVIILIIYNSFSDSVVAGVWRDTAVAQLVVVIALTVVLLFVALAVTTAISRRLGFATEDEVAAVFCGSKKSLANGAPIAKILFAGWPGAGLILLPLIIYHQVQLLVGAVLARRYSERA